MIGFGAVPRRRWRWSGSWLMRGGRNPAENGWFYCAALWTIPFPLLANSFGWIFTEMGRQPWVVFSQMFTRDGVSPLVGPGLVLTSLTVLTLLYLALAVVEVALLVRYAKAGPPETEAAVRAPIEPPSATRAAATTALPTIASDDSTPTPNARCRSPTRSRRDTPRVLVRAGRRSCSAATSCWRASTSASACCCRCSAATTSTAAS